MARDADHGRDMIPLLLTGLAAAGALGAFMARRWPAIAAFDCALALAATAAVALLVPIGPSVPLGEAIVRDSEAVRALVILGAAGAAVLLIIVALQAPDADVAILAGTTVAATASITSISDPYVALTASAAIGLVGLAGVAVAWRGAFAQVAFVPGAALAAVVLSGALSVGSGPGLTAAPVTGPIAVAILLAGALVARLGALPLHTFPIRLSRGSSLAIVPLQTAALPALFALVAMAWFSTSPLITPVTGTALGPLLMSLGGLTILLAPPAMLAQDDLGTLLAVQAISDLAVVIVVLGSGTPLTGVLAVWLAMVVALRIAAGGVAVAVAARMGSRDLRACAGWIRIAPLLLLGWIIVMVAGVGWPGSVIFEARRGLLEGALPGTLGSLLVLASMASGLGYLRLVVVGLGPPSASARNPVPMMVRFSRWAAVGVSLALAIFPLLVGLGGTRLQEALSVWQPFAPP